MRQLMPNRARANETKDTKMKTSKKQTSGRSFRAANSLRLRIRMVGLAAFISMSLSLAIFCIFSDKPSQWLLETENAALDWSVRNGFYVADVQVVGRNKTSTTAILKALNVKHNTPTLAIDLKDSQKKIEALPWVKTAQLERHLPNVLRITINERIPVAISQIKNKFMLVDADGVIIVPARAEMKKLPIITGRGAPIHIAALLKNLSKAPKMAKLVRAAVRVGDRRWNLRLNSIAGGVEVRLPEKNAAAAWQTLARLQNEHKLLQREVALIDMRLPDRLIVRLSNGRTLPAAHFGKINKHKRGEASA